MENTTNRQASIDSRRIALEREISIRVPRFDTFVTEYSSNISTTGMFIVSENPQPPGTTFSFEFSVADDWKLIRGKAQVVWTRYRDEGPERPPGMGVRFLEVDAQSRRLIRWIVEKHIREGGKPFELDELRTVIDQALEHVLDSDEIADVKGIAAQPSPRPSGPPAARSRPSVRHAASAQIERKRDRRVMPLLLTAAAVIVIVGLLFWLTEWLPSERSIARSETLAEVTPPADVDPEGATSATDDEIRSGAPTQAAPGTDPPTTTPTADTTSPERPAATETAERAPVASVPPRQAPATSAATTPPPIGSAYKTVLDAVTGWADAWSDQNVARYLDAYSKDFVPAGGMSRRQWQVQRRERLQAPNFIKVSISGLEIDRLDDDTARASFTQSYRSDRFSDSVRKTLDLEWEDGRWKIAAEGAR